MFLYFTYCTKTLASIIGGLVVGEPSGPAESDPALGFRIDGT